MFLRCLFHLQVLSIVPVTLNSRHLVFLKDLNITEWVHVLTFIMFSIEMDLFHDKAAILNCIFHIVIMGYSGGKLVGI